MKANTHGSGRVSAIGPCDVLLGRGTGPNENQGNKMFRDILRKYKEAYRSVETKKEKRDIVTTAIEEFKAVGGRFLERVVAPSQQQESSGKHCFEVVDGPAVSLKARQAFRYLLRGVEIDDDHKERNTPSRPNSRMMGADLPSQERHRLPTSHCSSLEQVQPTGTCEESLVSTHAIIPSQVENVNTGDLATSKDVMIDIHRLASLVSQAPMLARLGNSSHYCPTTSPWGQQGLIPLSFLPLRKIVTDTSASSRNPEMLLNAMRYPESWATDYANTHGLSGFLTNEIIGHCGQYHISPSATRAKLLDFLLENLFSPTTTTESLISSQYRQNLSEQSQQEVLESRIIEQRRVVARALMEHRLQAALVLPDLQRIMQGSSL